MSKQGEVKGRESERCKGTKGDRNEDESGEERRERSVAVIRIKKQGRKRKRKTKRERGAEKEREGERERRRERKKRGWILEIRFHQMGKKQRETIWENQLLSRKY